MGPQQPLYCKFTTRSAGEIILEICNLFWRKFTGNNIVALFFDSHRLWHVFTRDHTVLLATHTVMLRWNERRLPLLSCSRRATSHYGRYSFPVSLKVGGWVGLDGWLHTTWFARSKTVTHPSSNRARCRCTQRQTATVPGVPVNITWLSRPTQRDAPSTIPSHNSAVLSRKGRQR